MSKYLNAAPDFQLDGLRAMVKVDAVAQMEAIEAAELIMHLWEIYPQSLTDFTGLASTGQRGEQVKGLFTRTTYADKVENETEHGYRNTADRMMRNIIRNHDEQEQAERVSD